MRILKFYLIIVLFLISGGVYSQTTKNAVVDTIYVDSNFESQRGNLELLTQRIHNAFTAYVNGSTKVYQGRERPLVLEYDSIRLENIPINRNKLKRKTIDTVESIKVTYDSKLIPALYGVSGLYGIIEIKFIDDSKEK